MQQVVKDQVVQISTSYNAIADWEELLSKGEHYRLSPILTVELETLWESQRPVLFIGSIKDISSSGTDAYEVLLEQSLYNTDYIFSTELRMSLIAPKAVIDSFLQKHPKFLSNGGLNNGVAVIVKINSIISGYEYDEDGERVEIKTGQGNILELVYTGDLFF